MVRRCIIAILEGLCPECGAQLSIHAYTISCSSCHFQAKRSLEGQVEETTIGLTPKEWKSLLLLAAHAGKVILVYATLKKIPSTTTSAIMAHPEFLKSEYQKLLHFYDALAHKSQALLPEEAIPLLEEILGR